MCAQDPWSVLGVGRGSDAENIEQAFRRLAFRYHPDRNPGCPLAADNFRRVTNAVRQLRDVEYSQEKFTNTTSNIFHDKANKHQHKYRYGAQYSQAPGANPAARRPISARASTAVRVLTATALALTALATWKMNNDRIQRERAMQEWKARDQARANQRASRPTIGKGRRRAEREAEAK